MNFRHLPWSERYLIKHTSYVYELYKPMEVPMTGDEKDFEELWKSLQLWERAMIYNSKPSCRWFWCEARRTLREKIKSDPSIGKLVVEGEWPESPDY